MVGWTIVSPSKHREYRYRARDRFSHAKQRIVVPITLTELQKLLPEFVLAFINRGGEFYPVALLGLWEGSNWYVDPDGRWLSTYVPATLRGFPFSLAKTAEGDSLVLAIREDHLAGPNEQGEQLFGEEGSLTPNMQKTVEFLTLVDKSLAQTKAVAARLQKAGVLEPWSLELKAEASGETRSVEGLFRIDEKRLNELPDADFSRLRGAPLALAYAQLLSMGQVSMLSKRAQLRNRFHASSNTTPDLDAMFGSGDDELTFDFD